MDKDTIRMAVLEVAEASLAAQLKAIRSLRAAKPASDAQTHGKGQPSSQRGRSHIKMAFDILSEAGQPLHVNDILSRIAQRFNIHVDRESLVSALSKRVVRQDRFERTGKNTFALIRTDASTASRP